MKTFSVVTSLFLSAVRVLPLASSQPFYDVNIPRPVCARFGTITFKGDAEFVTTEDFATFPIQTGTYKQVKNGQFGISSLEFHICNDSSYSPHNTIRYYSPTFVLFSMMDFSSTLRQVI